ncbi:hypothetical protein V1515DRAFT_540632, partial [Lipomyces mesembrius]
TISSRQLFNCHRTAHLSLFYFVLSMSPVPVDPVDAAVPTIAPDVDAPVKKQRRRKAKQPKDADRETAAAEQAGTPEADDEAEGQSEEELKNSYIEIVQKRIRNLQKRKQRLDKYEEQAATPDAAKLNQDQLAALNSKDQVIYPLKELEDLSKSFKTLDEDHKKQKIKDMKSHTAEVRAAADQARREALVEARERIGVLVKFLHVASWKRQFASTAASEVESSAFENLLSLIYAGDDAAVEAVYKLADGADELVDEGATVQRSLTFDKIKQLSLESLDELYSKAQEETTAESVEDNIVITKTDVNDEDDEEPISSVVKVPRGGISFLNESELDQGEETAPAAPPPQTIADDVATEVAARPPAASQVDDRHANYAGATEWTENQPPVVLPTEPPMPVAEPVWEQSVAPDLPATTARTPSKQPQRQQILSNANAGSGRGGKYRGQGHRGRGGLNNGNGNSGERRGGRGYFRNRGGRQNQSQQQQSQQQVTT